MKRFEKSLCQLVKDKGKPLQPLGLSLWKRPRRRVRFSSLLTLMGEFSSLSAMADL